MNINTEYLELLTSLTQNNTPYMQIICILRYLLELKE